jgi:thiamine-monophosphate kinase
MDEFDIILKYFTSRTLHRVDVIEGSGDDCAILEIPSQQQLAVSMDTLIAGVHFPVDTSAYDIGYKSLAVNLSDLAAMAAEPAWITMSLTLPEANPDWLDNFAKGFFKLADEFNLQLIGGDITRGSILSITIQAHGFVRPHKALLRKGAKLGDLIYVTGTLGDAGLALQLLNAKQQVSDKLLLRLNQPMPRVSVGLALRDIANSAIDISDGLIADLNHILESSQVGASISLHDIPLSDELLQNIDVNRAIELALAAGDDYELCFTVPTDREEKLKNALNNISCEYKKIGVIEASPGIRLIKEDDSLFKLNHKGYKHFL